MSQAADTFGLADTTTCRSPNGGRGPNASGRPRARLARRCARRARPPSRNSRSRVPARLPRTGRGRPRRSGRARTPVAGDEGAAGAFARQLDAAGARARVGASRSDLHAAGRRDATTIVEGAERAREVAVERRAGELRLGADRARAPARSRRRRPTSASVVGRRATRCRCRRTVPPGSEPNGPGKPRSSRPHSNVHAHAARRGRSATARWPRTVDTLVVVVLDDLAPAAVRVAVDAVRAQPLGRRAPQRHALRPRRRSRPSPDGAEAAALEQSSTRGRPGLLRHDLHDAADGAVRSVQRALRSADDLDPIDVGRSAGARSRSRRRTRSACTPSTRTSV